MSEKLLVSATEVDPQLRKWLEQMGGRATFEEFFEAALYDPDTGYYSKNIRTVGQRGDFSTSATVDSGLPPAIANWITTTRKSSSPHIGDVIEIGAGDGSLANAVLTALPWLDRKRIRYHIVDTSIPLRYAQREKLHSRKKVRWHDSVKDALQGCDGRSLILSNELVDAFPPRVLQWNASNSSWKELGVCLNDKGNLAETLSSTTRQPELHNPTSFMDGQRIERHESYERWLADWLPNWNCGEMLTIDYGDEFPAVYHRRPWGTIRGYCHHLRFEAGPEIYARFGRQDLTADVDFTDLIQFCSHLGLAAQPLQSQGEFIHKFKGAKDLPETHLEGARSIFKVARFACTKITSPPA